jgi:hypothetical protein
MSNPNTVESLHKKLSELLQKEFAGVSPKTLATALERVAGDLSARPAGDLSSGAMSEPSPARAQSEPVSVALFEATAESDKEIARLLHQTLHVGAVVFEKPDARAALNDVVTVAIHFPTLHLHIETEGRIVHVSDRGTAVEVSKISKEDRVAMESLYEDYRDQIGGQPKQTATKVTIGKQTPRRRKIETPINRRPGSGTVKSLPGAKLGPSDTFSGFARRERTRRTIDLTDPDAKVLASSSQVIGRPTTTREFYGPAIEWVTPNEEPSRVEELSGDRIQDILLQLSQDGFTGMLEWHDESERRQLHFDGGLIVQVAINPRVADFELGPMLHRADRITKQQLSMAAAHADEQGCAFERSLLDLDILAPDRIRNAIAGRLTFLMREAAQWDEGTVEIYDSSSLPAGFLPTPPLRVHVASERILFKLLFESLRTCSKAERESLISDHLESYPELIVDEKDRVDRAIVDDTHAALINEVVTGRRRLKEVITESALSHADTFAILHGLHRMGLLRYDTSLHQTVVRERYRENVTVKYLSVHKASYFEVLNVHWSSYTEVVEKAYGELKNQFDPDAVPEKLEDEVHTRVREIRDRIDSAFQVLSNRETRHAYRKRIMPEYKLSHAIPLFMKQAELAERRQQWKEAKDAVLRVLEVDPDHKQATYKLERLDAILDNRLSPNPHDSNF